MNRSPTLTSQLIVERCIRENGLFATRRALLRALPRQIEYGALVSILRYLEASEKIVLAEDSSIVWVFADNPKLLKVLERSPVMRSEGTRTLQRTGKR